MNSLDDSLYILTGCSKGLGKDLYKIIDNVIGISRSKPDIHKDWLSADFSKLSSVINLYDQLREKIDSLKLKKITFINNAGIIEPIKKIEALDDSEIMNAIHVNLISPLMIIKTLVKLCVQREIQLNIVNVSSGAAFKAIEGWSLYSLAKSSFLNFSKSFEHEYPHYNWLNIDPGVMKTKMQEDIRKDNNHNFNWFETFQSFYANDELLEPSLVAHLLYNAINSEQVIKGFYAVRDKALIEVNLS